MSINLGYKKNHVESTCSNYIIKQEVSCKCNNRLCRGIPSGTCHFMFNLHITCNLIYLQLYGYFVNPLKMLNHHKHRNFWSIKYHHIQNFKLQNYKTDKTVI